MKGKKIVLSLLAVTFSAFQVFAESKVEGTIEADLVSSYVWRGQHNAGFSLQPTLGIGWKGLSLSAWGNIAIVPEERFKGTQHELDICLNYNYKGFRVGLIDYFFFENKHPYFKGGGIGETDHVLEVGLGYEHKYFHVNWYTNVAGNDGVNKSKNRAFSSYLQLDVPFHLAHIDWTASVGMVPYATTFYAQDKSMKFHVNVASLRAKYDIKCSKKFTLPVFAQLIANPTSRDMNFLVGFTLKAL